MAEFGAERHQITYNRLKYRCGGLDCNVRAHLFDGGGKLHDFLCQERLTTGNHHVTGREGCNFRQNLIHAPILALRPPGGVGRITPDATEIAARGANEYGWDADEPAFALYRIEYLGDAHATTLTNPGIRVKPSLIPRALFPWRMLALD